MEIIKYFPEEEYNKIPKDKIEFYKKNMDQEYNFVIDPNLDLANQNISKEASAIIVTLFRDYFATDEQKKKIEELIYIDVEKISIYAITQVKWAVGAGIITGSIDKNKGN